MQRSPRTALAATLAAALALPLALSCAPLLAAGGAAYIVHEEYLSTGVHETQLEADVDVVWEAAQESMEILSTASEAVVSHDPREILGEYRQCTVEVTVQAVDLDLTLLRVSAKQFVGYDEDVARDVSEYIVERIDGVRAEGDDVPLPETENQPRTGY